MKFVGAVVYSQHIIMCKWYEIQLNINPEFVKL